MHVGQEDNRIMLSNTLLSRFTQMQFDSKRLLLLPVMALLLGCGTKPSAFEAELPKESFRTGTLLVGEDIVPGRYFTNPKAGCYFARLSGLGGESSDIIANEFIGFDAVQWIVEIDPADLAFSTDAECGEWSKIRQWECRSVFPPGLGSSINKFSQVDIGH